MNKIVFPHEIIGAMSRQRKLLFATGIAIFVTAILLVDLINFYSVIVLTIGWLMMYYSGYKRGGWNNEKNTNS